MLKKLLLFLLLLYSQLIIACERPCRDAIAKSFTEKYSPLIHHVIDKLQDPLLHTIQQKQVPEQLSSTMPIDVLQSMLTNRILIQIQQLKNHTTFNLQDNIYNVMFKDVDPPFKGDCSVPKRLERKVPPPNESWTLQECELMDYVCGNPPSICHFLDMIKQRIIDRMKILLEEPVQFDGIIFKSLAQDTKQTIQGLMVKYGAGSLLRDQSVFGYINNIIRDMMHTFDEWVESDIKNLCDDPDQELFCGGWDNDIKYEILKFP
ncbi:hypothetical protein BJ944DRAFT_272896 [Cunninghamella echinulata]|nr:hypothetical protein BJ944DRAFT_272896 [Cunninghamella echinulata]